MLSKYLVVAGYMEAVWSGLGLWGRIHFATDVNSHCQKVGRLVFYCRCILEQRNSHLLLSHDVNVVLSALFLRIHEITAVKPPNFMWRFRSKVWRSVWTSGVATWRTWPYWWRSRPTTSSPENSCSFVIFLCLLDGRCSVYYSQRKCGVL